MVASKDQNQTWFIWGSLIIEADGPLFQVIISRQLSGCCICSDSAVGFPCFIGLLSAAAMRYNNMENIVALKWRKEEGSLAALFYLDNSATSALPCTVHHTDVMLLVSSCNPGSFIRPSAIVHPSLPSSRSKWCFSIKAVYSLRGMPERIFTRGVL